MIVETEDIPGSAVMHHVAYDVIMTSLYPVEISRDDNASPFRCEASVPYRDPVEVAITPQMQCKIWLRKGGCP